MAGCAGRNVPTFESRGTRQVAGRGASHVSLMAVVAKTEVMGMSQLQRL